MQEAKLDTLFDDARDAAGRRAGRAGIQRHQDRHRAAGRAERASTAQLLATLEREIYELAGREFNIGSPKQLQQMLFDEQKLPVLKKTKTGGSTDADVLEELARLHPLPAKIIEYRQYAKLKNTYVDALPQMVHPQTGRVHASFNQVVAATGRLSSQRSEPAEHSGAHRDAAARFARRSCRASRAGSCWRPTIRRSSCACWPTSRGDATLCAAFARDEDIHARVASEVYGVPLEEVTRDMRRQRQGGEFRRDLRPKPLRPGQAVGHRAGRGGAVHRRLFRPLSGGRGISERDTGRVPARPAMLVPSSAGDARFAAFDAARLASETFPNAQRSTRSSKARRPT